MKQGCLYVATYTDVNTTPRQDMVLLQVLHDSHVTQHRDGRPLKPDVSSPQLSKFLSLGQTSLVLPLCAFPTDSMRVRVRVRVRVHVHARANLQTWRLQRAAGRCVSRTMLLICCNRPGHG